MTYPISATRADTEQWRHTHGKCVPASKSVRFQSIDHARFVLNIHHGHGPGCQQFFAALSHLSGVCG